MNFSIKNTVTLFILIFTCSFLHGAETAEEGHLLANYCFYEKEDFIKINIALPVEIMSESTLHRINSPNSKGVAIKIKNDQLKYLENFYQLVDIEVYATPSPEEEGVTFEIKENLEKIPTSREILKDKITNSAKFFVKTDKHVDFRKDVLPKLTCFRDNFEHIKYVRFFTKN
jgi:hypothetical protein